MATLSINGGLPSAENKDGIPSFSYPNNPFAIIVNALFIGAGIYLVVKYWNSPDFWKGVLTLLLLFGLRIYYYDPSKQVGTSFPSNPKDGDTFTKDGIGYTWICIQLNNPVNGKPCTYDWYSNEYIKSLNLVG